MRQRLSQRGLSPENLPGRNTEIIDRKIHFAPERENRFRRRNVEYEPCEPLLAYECRERGVAFEYEHAVSYAVELRGDSGRCGFGFMGYDLRVAQDDAVQTVDVDCRERFIDRLDRCRPGRNSRP